MLPEKFSPVNIGKMNFHGRDSRGTDSIPDYYTGMGISSGINNHCLGPVTGLVDKIHDLPFVVRLQNPQLHFFLLGHLLESSINFL